MGCQSSPTIDENASNNNSVVNNPNNTNTGEEKKFKDFEEIGSKY